jgi:mannan endo-1,4-beta-mannosidase
VPPVSGFVERQSDSLVLNGAPFHIVGANIYYFGYGEEADQMSLLDIAESFGVNVLRIWAFNDYKDTPQNPLPGDAEVCFQFLDPATGTPQLREGPFGLPRLDHAVQLAGQRGIRLILTLTNYHADLGGMPQYQNWLHLASVNDIYANRDATAMFQNWVQAIVTRQNALTNLSYANDPAILAWEIVNEPRYPGDPAGTRTVTNWLAEMSQFIRANAPRQLIAAGDEGFFNHRQAGDNWLFNGSCGVSAEDILGIPTIDFGTFHMYPDQWNQPDFQAFGEMWIQNHIAAAQRATKPVILEEYGVPASAARNGIYDTWLRMIEDQNVAGDLVWMLGTTGDQYLLTNPNDAPAVRDHASRYATSTGFGL